MLRDQAANEPASHFAQITWGALGEGGGAVACSSKSALRDSIL